MAMLIKVIARFVDKATKKPLAGSDLTAKLYDNDLVGDDFIAAAKLDGKGKAEILADLDAARSFDSPLEIYPDLYISLCNQNGVIFESRVFKNVDFTSKDEVSLENRSRTRDLGTFEV